MVNPSKYAYLGTSVINNERTSANCRNYPSGLQLHVHTENYVYCNGTQLRLTDSDLGLEQHSDSDYYVWSAGITSQLLFIFPTRVNLTTITLHYYSDSSRGLPRLRFYAVPDGFDIWDAVPTFESITKVEIAAMAQQDNNKSQKRLSVSVTWNTRKILMYKYRSEFSFAVNEVQFSNCSGKSLKYCACM